MWFSFFITWEQRKLGDVVSRFATGLNPRDNFTLNSGGKNYYVTIKNFTHGNLVLDDNCDKIDDEALALIQARSDLRIGDILFSSIGRVGDCFLIEHKPINWNINESVFVLRPVKDAVDPLYLTHTIHSERVLSIILSCVTGSTFKSIKMAQLKETNIPYPSIAEQKQIGKFITAIDNLITLHQRKQNGLFLLILGKKSSLILANDWEQHKLGDIVSVCSGKDYKHLNEGDIPVYGTGGYMLSVSEALSYFDDAIGIGRKGTIDKPYILKAPFWTVDTLFYAVPKEKTALDFVYCLFQIIDWKSKDESTGVPSLSKVAINSVDISVPKFEEQVRIGTVFFRIDNLITLHQCKRVAFMSRKSSSIFQFEKWRNTLTWEQRKFGTMVQIERGGSPRPIDDYITSAPEGLNWVKIGDAPALGNYITKTSEKIKPSGLPKTREVHPGDLILSNSMSFGKPYIMAINGCIHDGWLLIRDTKSHFDLKFLCLLLGTDQMLMQYKAMASGSTVNNLNKELVGNTIVAYPQKGDQQVLGQFFEWLGNLITLHQRGEKIYNRRQTW